MHRAVFLDRDGTINEEMGYINHVSRFKVFRFVPDAIRLLNEAGYKVFVITNQSGVARGYFDEQLLRRVHKMLMASVEDENAKIEKIYYCPHHPDVGRAPYKKDCNCRKPKTGMIDKAESEFNIDLSHSYMVGDRYKDVDIGKRAGLKTIMVMTGYGIGEYTYQSGQWPSQPDYIFDNLFEAAKFLRNHP